MFNFFAAILQENSWANARSSQPATCNPQRFYLGPKAGPVTGGAGPGAAGEGGVVFLPLWTLALGEAVEKPGCSLLAEASVNGILTTS